MEQKTLSLLELSRLVASLVQRPETQNVWITAELSDVALRGGHCYMELLQKDERGIQVAKARGVIWANLYPHIEAQFRAGTGQQFATGLKVMLCVSASMHPVYGFSLIVSAVNPEYTIGDLMRRRREILQRLQQEGILEMNRTLQWPTVPQRIAVISAPGAAGYGDFINQLYNNPSRLRFFTRLYPATMQGNSAPASIINALEQIAAEADDMQWDGVVIIRGGGATSDLAAFEDYELAANVAQFPLPIAIGIGHERDITVLDWVANLRLKTPTAVAEWLVGTAQNALNTLSALGNRLHRLVADRIAGSKEQLAQIDILLPSRALYAIDRANGRLQNAVTQLGGIGYTRLQPRFASLDLAKQRIADITASRLRIAGTRLQSAANLLEALSPEATLKRGYSITRIGGKAITDPSLATEGVIIETTLANGKIVSTVIKQ